MNEQLRRVFRARAIGLSLVVALALCAGAIVIAAGQATQAGRSFEPTATPVPIGQSQTANGLMLTLESVSATASETQLVFRAALPAKIAASTATQLLGPEFAAPSELVLAGVPILPNGLEFKPQLHEPGQASFAFMMILGPADASSAPVSVSFRAMQFQLKPNDPQPVTLVGPWSFILPQSVFAANQPTSTQPGNAQTSVGGITIHLDQIENRASGLSVYYTISSTLPRPVQPIIPSAWLVFSDGSRSQPSAMRPQATTNAGNAATSGGVAIEPNQPQQFVSVFPPLAKSGGNATLEFSDFLTTIDQPASITIQNPFGQWSSSPITVQGETFSVTNVSYSTAERTLTIAIDNQDPITQANVLFQGVNVGPVTAIDAQGRTYTEFAGSSGMRRESDELMGAGRTSVLFSNVPTQTQSLTLTAPASGRIVRGTWSIPVTLP